MEKQSLQDQVAELSGVDVMKWERVDPPLFWRACDRYVVADRHLPDGTRQHMVKGTVADGLIIGNAQLVGEDDCVDAQFSDRLSHLSISQENSFMQDRTGRSRKFKTKEIYENLRSDGY